MIDKTKQVELEQSPWAEKQVEHQYRIMANNDRKMRIKDPNYKRKPTRTGQYERWLAQQPKQ